MHSPATSAYLPFGEVLGQQVGAVVQVLGFLAPVEPDDVGQELDLRRGEVAVGAVDLAEDVAGVEEEHLVGAGGLALAPVEEPEGAGQGDGVEEVGADGDHHIHGAGFDELLADLQLRAAGVGGGVGHDEAGAAGVVQGAVEELNPEVVGVVGAWAGRRGSAGRP